MSTIASRQFWKGFSRKLTFRQLAFSLILGSKFLILNNIAKIIKIPVILRFIIWLTQPAQLKKLWYLALLVCHSNSYNHFWIDRILLIMEGEICTKRPYFLLIFRWLMFAKIRYIFTVNNVIWIKRKSWLCGNILYMFC